MKKDNGSKQPLGRKRPLQKHDLNYYRSKNKEQYGNSPFEKRPAKRTFKVNKFLSRAFDVILVAALVYFVGYSLIVREDPTVIVNGTTFHPSSYYQAAVKAQLGGFKNSNKITFNEASIIKNLKSKYPEISQANISLPFIGQNPKVTLTISDPAFKLKVGSNTYLINSQGTALPLSSTQARAKNLMTVEDQSGYDTSVGKQVLSSSSVAFIASVIKQCLKANIPVSGLILPQKVQEIDLKTTDRPYYVKYFIGGDANLQTGQYLAARHKFDQTGQQPSEYLDVRVNGKVYYR